MTHKKIKTGYLYHIKDEYFDIVDDDTLMKNINSSPYELMNTSKFTDEGVENINEKYGKEK